MRGKLELPPNEKRGQTERGSLNLFMKRDKSSLMLGRKRESLGSPVDTSLHLNPFRNTRPRVPISRQSPGAQDCAT